MTESIDELLERAFSDPRGAIAAANQRFDEAEDEERCELHRVVGNACRELRQVDESVKHLETALQLAVDLDARRLEGNAAMSLAASLSYQGNFARSLEMAGRSIELLDGDDHIIAMSQRAGLLQRAGQQHDALAAFGEALDAAGSVHDQTIIGDIWMNRGVLMGMFGNVEDAERDTQNAMNLFAEVGWDKRAVDMQHNLAWLAGRRGDVVEALTRFQQAERGYEALGLTTESVFPDRCEVLVAAGLAQEAMHVAEVSARQFENLGNEVDAAETLLLVARAALVAGDCERALAASEESATVFTEQGRAGWNAEALALGLQARLRLNQVTPHDRDRAAQMALEADQAGLVSVSAAASLLGAEIALQLGDTAGCRADLEAVDGTRLGSADQFRLDLVQARLAASTGHVNDALQLCTDGVHRFSNVSSALGGTELRAHVARHVEELVDFAMALALEADDPALVFTWAERQRASVLSVPPVHPPDDPELESELNVLRAAISELEECTQSGVGVDEAAERCAVLQDRVRRRTRQLAGSDAQGDEGAALDELLAATDTAYVVFVESDDRLHSIRVEAGKVDVRDVCSVADISSRVSMLQSTFSMYLTAIGRGVERDPAIVLADAEDLGQLLFPGGQFGVDNVVISPTSRIYDLPWGLMPELQQTSFVMAPSIESHLRCVGMATSVPTSVAAIAGPDLQFADREASAVGDVYASSTLLAGPTSNVDSVKRGIEGADVTHFVCHGRFVSGNPMFSSLRLGDGQMFVHEIERLRPAPRIAVLSACNAGLHASPAGHQTLGLTTSLLAGGSRSVVAATVPVPDTVSTVESMQLLHQRLVAGDDVATALRAVRAASPVIGGAFSCHGAP